MLFIVEPKNCATRPWPGATQADVHDKAQGPDIICLTNIGGGRVTVLEQEYADDHLLKPTLSLTLTEARTLYRLLEQYLADRKGL